MGRAMEMIITGRVIGAEEALRIGLANEVVPSGKGLERALELAKEIAALPLPVSVAAQCVLVFLAESIFPAGYYDGQRSCDKGFRA